MQDNLTEWAWAAGFIDGEGHFRFEGHHGRGQFTLTVGQVRREPLDRLQQILGGRIVGPYVRKTNNNASPIFYFRMSKNAEVVSVMDKLMPYLSAPKQEQATAALTQWLERPPAKLSAPPIKEFCIRGHDYSDSRPNANGRGRRCRACDRERYHEKKRILTEGQCLIS